MKAQIDKLAGEVARAEEKVGALKRKLNVSTTIIDGVKVEVQGANAADPHVAKLWKDEIKAEEDRNRIMQQKATADEELQSALADFEQQRRRVIVSNPIAGDPEFHEHNGQLYTPAEWMEFESFQRDHSSPQNAADAVVRGLVKDGTLERATILDARKIASPWTNQVDTTRKWYIVRFQVRYVSRAGLVNDRAVHLFVYEKGDVWFVESSLTGPTGGQALVPE